MNSLESKREAVNEQDAESKHWFNVMRILQSYKSYVERGLSRRHDHLNRLPEHYCNRLPESSFQIIRDIDQAADCNQQLLTAIVMFQKSQMHHQGIDGSNFPSQTIDNYISESDQHRNTAILHSLYREWTIEGKSERESTFVPLINELTKYLPVNDSNAYQLNVLVPGSGLGRLPLEITARGYCCQGNEYSAFMAAPANFILNKVSQPGQFTIYPWVDKICNVIRQNDVLQSMKCPDVAAEQVLNSSTFYQKSMTVKKPNLSNIESELPPFSMGIGNFVELYFDGPNKCFWDAVVTCFFLDTAPVVMEYIETISHCLKPGGIWTNMGPLLYHWVEDVDHNRDERYTKSIEVTTKSYKHFYF